MKQNAELDGVDRRLLALLQEDGRRPQAELGAAVGLAVSSVNERIRRLERTGVLRPTVAVDPDAVGLPLLAFTLVALASEDQEQRLLAAVAAQPHVLECHHVTGEWNYLLKIRAAGTADLERILTETVKRASGAHRTLTTIALSSAKETAALPLHPREQP
ncbi:MAG: Lrp/AsnC family transcriptional regulator [Alphaproteobacteria bacterium]|nr:Lrp/AsnC family transcriptional regulator [Alphaproteobacteria bacterium]TAD92040.1 MAG: Lrp/AsnC family transcriptional regulator [Alphaproteobacteria bacterium]